MSNNKKNKVDKNAYKKYNNSSSAYDFYKSKSGKHLIATDDEIRKSVQKSQNRRRRRDEELIAERKRKSKLRKIERINRINRTCFFILAFYLVCSLIFILNQFDKNNNVKRQIVESQETIKQQEKEIAKTKMAVADSINIEQIESIAKEEYGMKEPSTDQIVYITLPENVSYIEYSENKATSNISGLEGNQIINDVEKQMTIEGSNEEDETQNESSQAEDEATDDNSNESDTTNSETTDEETIDEETTE